MHWVSAYTNSLQLEVKSVDEVWLWQVIDLSTGELLNSGNTSHPLHAMSIAAGFACSVENV
jgi:hypothetical protein